MPQARYASPDSNGDNQSNDDLGFNNNDNDYY